jgi:hypothetical protein
MWLYLLLALILVSQSLLAWLLFTVVGSIPMVVESSVRRLDDRVEKRLSRQEAKAAPPDELGPSDTVATNGDIPLQAGVSYRR